VQRTLVKSRIGIAHRVSPVVVIPWKKSLSHKMPGKGAADHGAVQMAQVVLL
jgi:hypothetical protein